MSKRANRAVPKKGIAALYLFPFHVDVAAEGARPLKVSGRDRLFRVYWPHVDSGDTGGSYRQPRFENVPTLIGVEGFGRLPLIKNSGIVRNWGTPSKRADALRIDFYPEKASDDAEVVASRFVRLLRWRTRQWWVNRDMRFAEPLHRNSVTIDSRGALRKSGHLLGGAKNIGTVGYERLLSPKLFQRVCRDLEEGSDIPLSWDFLLDANYFHAIEDTRRAVHGAAMACEALVDERTEEVAGQRGIDPARIRRQVFDSTKLSRNLDQGFENLIGRSFAEERPKAFSVIDTTWAARHGMAHGKKKSAPLPNDPDDPSEGASRIVIIRAVLTLFDWAGDDSIPERLLWVD